jgi:hypothetical protein
MISAFYHKLADLRHRYRRACSEAIYADHADAGNRYIEEALWNTHTRINARLRKDLRELKKRGQNNAVEIRKATKSYLDFLKSSQRFYRSFICDLDLYNGGIVELRKVAGQLEPQRTGAGSSMPQAPSHHVRELLLNSCYLSLIHLGDLSRYRETECSNEPPKWGPALGYYNLAVEICPESGFAHNQLAVIALADSSHMRAVYHLYRSISVMQPHPLGQKNLEIEFKKISTAFDKGELIPKHHLHSSKAPKRTLIAWYLRLHSQYYIGLDFGGRRELEDEVLGQLAREIKDESSTDTLLPRLSTINLAAGWLAAQKLQGLLLQYMCSDCC